MLINEKLLFRFVENEPCRKCETPLKKVTPKKKGGTSKMKYYYAYFYRCPGCKTIYMPEDGKRDFVKGQRTYEQL